MTQPQDFAGSSKHHNGPFSSFADFYSRSAYAAFPQKVCSGGSFAAYMLEAKQPAIDLIDAPLPEFIFAHVVSGSPEIVIDAGDGRTRAIHTLGTVGLSPPNTELRFTISAPHVVRTLVVPEAKLSKLFALSELSINRLNTLSAQHVHRPEIMPLLQQMWDLVQANDPTRGLFLDGLFLQYLATVARATELSPIATGKPEDARIVRVIDYIEAHIGDAMTVAELALVACLSPGHFSRSFKATTGEAVWAYVQRRRCERARDMLLSTREPIAHIAHACGFSNQAHMTRQLSARFGATPGAIRREG